MNRFKELSHEERKQALKESADYYCDILSIDKKTIKLHDDGLGIEFGNIEEDGHKIIVTTYYTGDVSKMMISLGKNADDKLIYHESADEDNFTSFIDTSLDDYPFVNWFNEESDKLERRFCTCKPGTKRK